MSRHNIITDIDMWQKWIESQFVRLFQHIHWSMSIIVIYCSFLYFYCYKTTDMNSIHDNEIIFSLYDNSWWIHRILKNIKDRFHIFDYHLINYLHDITIQSWGSPFVRLFKFVCNIIAIITIIIIIFIHLTLFYVWSHNIGCAPKCLTTPWLRGRLGRKGK